MPCRHLLPPPAPPAQCFYNLLLKLHCPQLRKGLNLITNRQNMRLLFDRHLHSDGDKPGLGAHTAALLTLALRLELSLQSSLRRSPPSPPSSPSPSSHSRVCCGSHPTTGPTGHFLLAPIHFGCSAPIGSDFANRSDCTQCITRGCRAAPAPPRASTVPSPGRRGGSRRAAGSQWCRGSRGSPHSRVSGCCRFGVQGFGARDFGPRHPRGWDGRGLAGGGKGGQWVPLTRSSCSRCPHRWSRPCRCLR